jgi:hypothetical protein
MVASLPSLSVSVGQEQVKTQNAKVKSENRGGPRIRRPLHCHPEQPRRISLCLPFAICGFRSRHIDLSSQPKQPIADMGKCVTQGLAVESAFLLGLFLVVGRASLVIAFRSVSRRGSAHQVFPQDMSSRRRGWQSKFTSLAPLGERGNFKAARAPRFAGGGDGGEWKTVNFSEHPWD